MPLDEKQQWIERVLGYTFAQDQADDPFEPMYRDLAATVTVDLQRLRASDPEAAKNIGALVKGVEPLAAKGEFEKAFGYLDRASTALAQRASAARVAAAKQAVPEGKVAAMVKALSQAQQRWDAALATALAGARSFQTEIEGSFPDEAAGFERILESYWQDLADALRAAQAGSGDESGRVGGVLQTMQALRAEMMGDKLFTLLDRSGVSVRPTFVRTFGEIEAMLSA
jgi:hypothetical protein